MTNYEDLKSWLKQTKLLDEEQKQKISDLGDHEQFYEKVYPLYQKLFPLEQKADKIIKDNFTSVYLDVIKKLEDKDDDFNEDEFLSENL